MAERTGTLVRHLAPDDAVTAELAAAMVGGDAALADELRAAAADEPLHVLLAVREDALVGVLLGELTPGGYRVLRLGTVDADGASAAHLLEELTWIAGDGTIELLADPAGGAEVAPFAEVLDAAGFEAQLADGDAADPAALVRRPPAPPDMYGSLADLVAHLRACRLEHLVRVPGEWLQVAVRRGRQRAVVDVGWDAANGEVVVLVSPSPVPFEARVPMQPGGVGHAELFAAIDAAVTADAEASERAASGARQPSGEGPARSLLQLPISSR